MDINLSKREKKLARELIEKGILQEFKTGLEKFDAILQEWKNNDGDNREYYHKLFSDVHDFDKHIARRYDGMTGSKYLSIVSAQIADGLHDISTIEPFGEEAKNHIQSWLRFMMRK